MMAEQRSQRRALAEANQQLARYAATMEQLAITRERNRVARELHDTLAHTQSGVIVQMEGADALWQRDPDRARSMFHKSLDAMRTGLSETRRALEALRATPLEDMGLKLAITELAHSMAEWAGFKFSLSLPETLPNFSAEVEQAIYRVVQEALTNITRHATAGKVSVTMVQEDEQLRVEIRDDGRGFVMDEGGLDKHFGLRGMRERADSIGAVLTVQSVVGAGTVVGLSVKV
jgi:signal transduction histidine kinase